MGVFWEPIGAFSGWSTLKKSLGSKEHLDWLKIDLNATEIITVQDYKHKKLVWMEVHICSVKAMESSRYYMSQKFNDNIKSSKPQDTQLGMLKM